MSASASSLSSGSSPMAPMGFRCILRLVSGPALLTLAVTLLRLILEGVQAPDWLASRKAGGGGALIGIAWLPLVFGPFFVARLRAPGVATWPLVKRLLKVLVIYGWASRLPVVIVTFLAVAFGWDTHFNKFGQDAAQPAMGRIVLGTLAAQLVFWSVIWTPIVGGVAGIVYHRLTRGKETKAATDPSPRPA